MNFTKEAFIRMPDDIQDKMMGKIIASNKWKSMPTFNMLFESNILMGADRQDMIEAFSSANDMGYDLYKHCRRVGKEREKKAEAFISEPDHYIEEKQKALMMFFLADWVARTDEEIDRNYKDFLKISVEIDKYTKPSVEKIVFPWTKGKIFARLRFPENTIKKVPVIILFQGNDTVKETLRAIEDVILEQGMAILNVDQVGWGESRLTGNRYKALDNAEILGHLILDFCKRHEKINEDQVCLFGFSGGGTWSAMTAGSDRRFKYMVMLGGGIYDLGKAMKHLPVIQKRQVFKHWGCDEQEFEQRKNHIDFNKILPKIQAQTLLIHGTQDSLIPIQGIREAAKLINGPVELKEVEGGDHMCTDTMKSVEIPYMMEWLRKKMHICNE